MRKRSWIACAVACALGMSVGGNAQGQNRYYFQGAFGPGGTYNLYELKGIGDLTINPGQHFGRFEAQNAAALTFNTGAGLSWWDAHNGAATTTESVSGTNKPAHLAAFSGPTAQAENNFVHQQAFFGDVWIGLSDDEAINGGAVSGAAETGSGDPVADGVKGLNNATPGWRWTSGEVFDWQAWGGGEPNNAGTGGEDAAHIRGDSLWNDNGDGLDGEGVPLFKYVYEYETQSAAPLNIPNSVTLSSTPSPVPGAKGGLGYMSVREVHSPNTVSGNTGALNLLHNGGGDAEVTYQAATLNLNNAAAAGGGQYGGDAEFGLNTVPALAGTDINSFAVSAKGYFRIPEGQGGQYTFNVNTDDSGELWIYGKNFESVVGGSITSYGSMGALGDRGAADTLGVVTLEPGDYEFEYVMNENGGGASAELSAAKGAHTVFSHDQFTLVGSNIPEAVFPGGTTPKISGQFATREVLVQPDDSLLIENLTTAKQVLATTEETHPDYLRFAGNFDTVNFHDPTTNASPSGRFGTGDNAFLNDTSTTPPDFDDDDFVMEAKATVVIDTAGVYTFGFDSDDGAEIILEGANFTNAFGPAVANGTALTADILTGSSLSGGYTFLEQGEYELTFTFFERGGGAFAELFVAPGQQPAFSAQTFALLSPTAATVTGFTRGASIALGDGTFNPDPGQTGDTDGDGDVDLDDLNNVRNNFGATGIGDTDGDDDVDLDDLNNVRNNFGAGPSNSVPEPSSLALIGLGLAGLFGLRKFRK